MGIRSFLYSPSHACFHLCLLLPYRKWLKASYHKRKIASGMFLAYQVIALCHTLTIAYPQSTFCTRISAGARCLFHKYTASSDGLASFPRKRESRRRGAWGLDARLRGYEVLLVLDLRNGHLARLVEMVCPNEEDERCDITGQVRNAWSLVRGLTSR
jgi:hypothetical protein